MIYLFPDSVLLIFCKAPIAGQVKTRLQPALTAEQAADAHRRLARMTLERAFGLPLCPVVLCCAPNAEHAFFRQCAADYPLALADQRGNDLGERMRNAFAEALRHYRQAILIGCDCPSLTADDLRAALAALGNGSNAVISPAIDGGYVLIGMKTDQPVLFSGMPWGTDKVMAETRRRAEKAGISLCELESQWDVDTLEDWERYLKISCLDSSDG
ncbi:TIGR04282 family arsenosugar biosynthesis glycosyltransferase [Candidatus Methylomicrobium oryzae]|jgi:rSAM/selenodomain-associated transferase 1|uniref:TIGR04282 family arsenosugar biosynthesis glycosyltransferase n=1 Tax=Candidatus Methylomicrobium oryzae TaxID=2802053 RepID=UPI001923491E|nr:TIGR04282 family arsenosugar biosynthesis glycosyltransferase [Methylomicrobium sp. RS1]MBL1262612.1 TIGR04282 family arsenosugar biosynthesis glycosyltransferase [Methylomicrobium sp. RS1]